MEMLFGQKLNETSIKKINAIINPPKLDKNQALIKRAITLFYQLNPIEDFDPVQQFDLIEKIPIAKQKFCQLLTDVIFKKTKSLFLIKSNFQSLTKGKKDNQKQSKLQHQEETLQKVQKSEYIIQNEEKIFCEILTKIRSACSRLQQLFYRMIDIHGWKCQSKKNCPGTYFEGHIVKVLFKRLILPYEGFQRELKALIEQKQLRCESKTDIESLRYEIQKWGMQLFLLIGQQKLYQESLDQKSSSEIKYFVCKSCYYGQKFTQKSEVSKTTKNKQNKKKKKKKVDGSFSQSSQGASRKDSLLSIEDKSTTDEIDEQAKFLEEKTYERLYSFLQDLKIDHDNDNRIELRLDLEQGEHSEDNILLKRMKIILYKDYK